MNGAAIIFFAYLGYDAVATLAEEVRLDNAQRICTASNSSSRLFSQGLLDHHACFPCRDLMNCTDYL